MKGHCLNLFWHFGDFVVKHFYLLSCNRSLFVQKMLPACFIIDDGWRFYIEGLSGLLKNFMLNIAIISPNSFF